MPLYRDTGPRDGRDQFGVSLDEYAAQVLTVYARRFHRPDNKPHTLSPTSQVAEDAPPLTAFVNSDRWVVRCDREKCANAQFVWHEQPLYMCATCFNQRHGYSWRRVELPEPKRRAAIEAILGHRAEVENRNWERSESVAELKRQNRQNGESVPKGGG